MDSFPPHRDFRDPRGRRILPFLWARESPPAHDEKGGRRKTTDGHFCISFLPKLPHKAQRGKRMHLHAPSRQSIIDPPLPFPPLVSRLFPSARRIILPHFFYPFCLFGRSPCCLNIPTPLNAYSDSHLSKKRKFEAKGQSIILQSADTFANKFFFFNGN